MDRPVKSAVFSRASTVPCSSGPLRLSALLAVLASLFAALPLACNKTTVVQCDEAKCASGERCVQDACRPSCTTSSASTACGAGQSCALWGFPDGTQGDYCVVLPGADAGSGGSHGGVPSSNACTANADCASEPGEHCVNGSCQLSCSSHFDCQSLGQCTGGTDSDGNPGHYCDLSKPQKPGQFYTSCPSGAGSECDSSNDFFCVGAGAGDLDAYCTTDCSSDDTCAPGFACTPLTRNPCGDDCGLTGTPKDRMCVPSDQIGPGQPFQCGNHGVTRNVCRPRTFCTTCETDVDCLATANQICAADQSGAKICTELCDPAVPSCPWGNAGICGVWDQDLGVATCAHRFGKCVGDGKSCDPCEKDADCGSNGVCTESSFTGEHWCVDFDATCSCDGLTTSNDLCTGGGCPTSPSGLELECQLPSATASAGICVGANTVSGFLASASSPQTGCWPQH